MSKIAIVGLACLFPGAQTPAEYWETLVHGQQTTSDATAAELGVDPAHFYAPERVHMDKSYFLHGGYVRAFHPVDEPPRLKQLDRMHRWSLHVAKTALADSGQQQTTTLQRTGVILGNLSFPTRHSNQLLTRLYKGAISAALAELTGTSTLHLNNDGYVPAYTNGAPPLPHDLHSPGYPAALVAAQLGLGGPHFGLDAACASSLYALELACAYLRSGQADLMLAGAVSAADALFVNLGFAHLGGYPSNGTISRPLDETSGGLIAGEGAGMFVLKRHADALRDGDKIYALVSGIGLSNDGRGKHVLSPNSKGQVTALQRAYTRANISLDAVDYIECHASGTAVGDRTELNSIAQFFNPGTQPLIGSVKSNVGHLLTAAGMASMVKLILSLAHHMIPATINNQQPLRSYDGTINGTQIVSENTQWPPHADHPRRAGVNAFGFGGVSAHVILEANERQAKPETNMSNQQINSNISLAITGMGAHFGPLDSLDAFARALYDGDSAFIPLPDDRWKGLQHHPELLAQFGLPDGNAPDGAYIAGFELDFMQYGIPPNPADEPIPQQLLVLKVADQALRDAHLQAGSNVAVLVALDTELSLHQVRGRADLNWQVKQALANAGVHLDAAQTDELERIARDALLTPAQVNHFTSYIGNLAASRIAALWDFSGPAFTISAEENSVYRAVEVARLMLANGEVEAVVVGAVDLAGGVESVLVRNAQHPLHQGPPTAGIDAEATGWMVGEGAGAIVLTRADAADPAHIYATIDALAFVQSAPDADNLPTTPDASTIQQAAQQAMSNAGISPTQIGYVEMHASGIALEDVSEITALTALYKGDTPETAFGTVKANIGHTFAASGMAALIKTTLCLSGRFIPAIPNWGAPKLPAQWAGTALWAAHKSRTWFAAQRFAAINGLGADGSAAHLILSDRQAGRQPGFAYLRGGSPYLFPLAGDTANVLIDKLHELRNHIHTNKDLSLLADEVFADYTTAPNAAFTVALVGRHVEEVLKQIDAALRGVPDALASGGAWSTPVGSTFTTNPVGQRGEVAFVYPGAFNSYPKLGYDLLHLFPQLYAAVQTVKQDVGGALNERLLYPRTLAKPGPRDTRQMKETLGADATSMVESGLAFALLYSRMMQDIFGVRPKSAFGYSLGEGSMLWGMGVWRDGDAGSAALRHSPLFTTQLAGPMQAVREAWAIPADVPTEQFWAAHFIAADADAVKRAAMQESKVYVTHINTPKEVMIAGDPAACERVIAAVGGESMRAPFAVAIHNPAMMSAFSEFRRLHDLPVHPVEGVRFYSAADYAPLPLSREVIATSIARMTCAPVDFTRLIEHAYADGARVFIELGPRSTCARWVDETLGTRPHVAVSVDNMGVDDRTSLVRMLAQLAAHRLPLDLSALYRPLAEDAAGRSLIRMVTLGGEDIYAAIVNDENREKIGTAQPAQTGVPVPSRQSVTMPAAKRMTALPDDISRVHADFLRARQDALLQMGDMISAQIADMGSAPARITPAPAAPLAAPTPPALKQPPAPQPNTPPSVVQGITPLYPFTKINAFAIGRVADCYGERYTIYDDRRAPRIPNGHLLLVSRAVDISGERFVSKPGTAIHAEYDVPADAWWYQDNPYPAMPLLIYMEIALQPSGFLSAYHGPTLGFPEIDFYFRNLDGFSIFHHDLDLRGRTITNHVTMLNHTTMSGIIIEKFSFKMYDGDLLFYEGEATFGYFTLQALDSQAGLDAGKLSPRWLDTVELDPAQVITLNPRQANGNGYLQLPPGDGMLAFTDEIKVVLEGGKYGQGYTYANTIIDPSAWFFKAHFHQDPVMPGSIGVETIMQALQAFAIESGLGAEFESPHFGQLAGGHKMVWRYRGQVLSGSEKTHVEANIKEIRREPGKITVIADASLWRDKLRIYEINDIGLTIVEG